MANTLANRGKSLEDALDWVHAQYRAAGHIVERTEPPTRAGSIGARPCRFSIPGTAGILDYLVITDSVSYRFDAKSTQGKRWPLNLLELEQARNLDAYSGMRGWAPGLVVQTSVGVWWLPWSERVRARWWGWWATERAAAGLGSLDAAELDLLGERCEGYDWLGAAARLWCREVAALKGAS